MQNDELDERRASTLAQAAHWDARYSERAGQMWSGRPNGRLVAEVAALPPGRALDVGCGEGADAIWLAKQGWAVTAIDISAVAIGRAKEAAQLAGAPVEWVCDDVLATSLPARSFDLVSLQYPALPKPRASPRCKHCSIASVPAGCCSPSTTTSTTSTASR